MSETTMKLFAVGAISNPRGLLRFMVFLVSLGFFLPSTQVTRADSPRQLDFSVTGASLKEQIKNGAGEASGALFSSTSLMFLLQAGQQISPWLSVGGFVQLEGGNRSMFPYAGTSSAGTPKVGSGLGGKFTTLWLGPFVRVQWRALFLDAGYTLLGWRWDEQYSEISTPTGDRSSAFNPHSSKAWVFGIGGALKLSENWDATLRFEYRYHYYDKRGGHELEQDLLLGSQAIRPVFGARYSF